MKFSTITKLTGLFSIVALIFFSCEKDLAGNTTWISPGFHTATPSMDTVKLTVFSIFDWEVVIAEDAQDWLTSNTVGLQAPVDEDSVMFYIARNRSRDIRKTTVNIKFAVEGFSDRTFDITQTGVQDLIEVTTEEIRVAKGQSEIVIDLDTNVEWEIAASPAWIKDIVIAKISYDDATGLDTYKITATVTENNFPYYQLGSFQIRGTVGPEGADASETVDYITIFQDGNSSLKTDTENLRKLYESTNGDGWKTKWDLSQPVSKWSGVVLDSVNISKGKELRVVSLDLANNNLIGAIPTELFNVSFLKRLWLSDNSIAGELPVNLSYLIDMENLNLNNNSGLTGVIPANIEKMINIITLSISNTAMSGMLPEGLGELSMLNFLDLSGNDFSGTLPVSLGDNDGLSNLFLMNNMFSGDLPASYRSNANWYNWNVTDYLCPQKQGFGFTNCSEFE